MKYSPFYLLHGVEATQPTHVITKTYFEPADNWCEKLLQEREQARINLIASQKQQKTYFDKVQPNTLQIEDWVWLRNRPRPFRVIDISGPSTLRIQMNKTGKPNIDTMTTRKIKLFVVPRRRWRQHQHREGRVTTFTASTDVNVGTTGCSSHLGVNTVIGRSNCSPREKSNCDVRLHHDARRAHQAIAPGNIAIAELIHQTNKINIYPTCNLPFQQQRTSPRTEHEAACGSGKHGNQNTGCHHLNDVGEVALAVIDRILRDPQACSHVTSQASSSSHPSTTPHCAVSAFLSSRGRLMLHKEGVLFRPRPENRTSGERTWDLSTRGSSVAAQSPGAWVTGRVETLRTAIQVSARRAIPPPPLLHSHKYLLRVSLQDCSRASQLQVQEAAFRTTVAIQHSSGKNLEIVLRTEENDEVISVWISTGMQGQEKQEICEKIPPTSGIVRQDSTCENPGATQPGIEPHSPRWEASGTVVTHQTHIQEEPGSIPGPAILRLAFRGFPKSLQANAEMSTKQRPLPIPSESLFPAQLVPSLIYLAVDETPSCLTLKDRLWRSPVCQHLTSATSASDVTGHVNQSNVVSATARSTRADQTDAYAQFAGMKGQEKREIPDKKNPADQRHRPARFPHAKIRNDPVGLAEVSLVVDPGSLAADVADDLRRDHHLVTSDQVGGAARVIEGHEVVVSWHGLRGHVQWKHVAHGPAAEEPGVVRVLLDVLQHTCSQLALPIVNARFCTLDACSIHRAWPPDASPMAIAMSQHSLQVIGMASLSLMSCARPLTACLTTDILIIWILFTDAVTEMSVVQRLSIRAGGLEEVGQSHGRYTLQTSPRWTFILGLPEE
ncbi:hypothetical protein PR048_011967 [Dryococelus australis]|uniref:Uncharacterized protein n=1 Tax=Dryococelus australis TaxID=614101 RepID=A0ABQ9HN57_9NEOP|nr:hypothetical protein PR048_011967 [Dryococelus australis]